MTTVSSLTRSINGQRHYIVRLNGDEHAAPSVNTLKAQLNAPALSGWLLNRHLNTAHEMHDEAAKMDQRSFRSFVRSIVRQDTSAIDLGNAAHEAAEVYWTDSRAPRTDIEEWVFTQLAAFHSEFDVKPVAVEQGLAYVDDGRVILAGTTDLLAEVTIDGRRQTVIIDWKTGASGVWADAALTTAGYCLATHIIGGEDGVLDPIAVTITGALVVWLRPDGYAVHPVSLADIETTRPVWHALRDIHTWRMDEEHKHPRPPINTDPLRKR